MKPSPRSASLALVAGVFVFAACANSEVGTTPGSAGSSGPGTAGTTGAAGTTGVAGTTGSGGTTTGAAGTTTAGAAGTTGSGGSASGSAGNGSAGNGSAGSGAAGTTGRGGTTGTAGSGSAGSTGTAGATGAAGATGTAGATGAAGRGGAGGSAAGATGTGGRGGAAGGAAGRGGTTGTAGGSGTGGGSSVTGAGGAITTTTALDCGPNGFVVENHGPPANRVNYVILGDGFTSADLGAGGKFEQDIANAMSRRFSPNAFPYNRYRNFVNICGIKLVSTGAICGSSMLNCCGDDTSRLANCDNTKVNAAFNALPTSLSTDWRAVMLNGSSWWNSGGTTMLFSGGNTDAPGAALHEGGHGFHQLADEYGTCTGASCGTNTMGSGSTGTAYQEINSCGNPSTTDGKWDMWIGYNATGATGVQGTFDGSRYIAIGAGQYRPSANSMMNSLFCNNSNQTTCTANTAYNQVSREQMVMSIWRVVKPIDSTEPVAGAVTSPGVLKVNVVDPVVISVDWTVDGTTMTNAGTTFDTSTLGAGSHTVSAKAYDNAGTDLVRYRNSTCPASVTGSYCHRTSWKNSIQTVTWTFTK